MHREPGVTQEIDRPVPAIGRFDHHLRAAAGRAHHLEQPQRVVVDPLTEQLLALGIHRVDHRTATMQSNPDVTSTHRGLPSSTEESLCGESRVSRLGTSRGAEAPLLHRISYVACDDAHLSIDAAVKSDFGSEAVLTNVELIGPLL